MHVDIESVLEEFSGFSECLLHDVRWRRYGSEIDLLFNVVWDASGRVRERVLEEPRLVTVRLHGVQRLDLDNHLTPAMLDEPDQLDWGLSEIAAVGVESHEMADRVGYILSVMWEGPRRLQVVAAGITVGKGELHI